jgi:hypothetical protein
MDGRETLLAQSIGGHGGGKAPEVAIDDGLVNDPTGASGVPCRDDRRREGEDDGDGRHARSGCPDQEGPSRGRLDVRRIDDDESPCCQLPLQLAMEDRERRPRRSLVGGVTRDHLAVRIGREDLGRGEETGGQRRLAGTGGPDENDE